jgi:hypothetical protein
VNATNSPKDGSTAEKGWKEIVLLFRRLCFLRRMGRSDESARLLRKDLPELIAQWSRSTSEPYTSKRLRLARMFQAEQRRVADACMLHELSLTQWQQDMVPMITQQITQEIKTVIVRQLETQAARQQQLGQEIAALAGHFEEEASRIAAQESVLKNVQKTVEAAVQKLPPAPVRIPFDDIQSIIDQIHDEERRTPSARKKFAIQPPHGMAPSRSDAPGEAALPSREVREAVA